MVRSFSVVAIDDVVWFERVPEQNPFHRSAVAALRSTTDKCVNAAPRLR